LSAILNMSLGQNFKGVVYGIRSKGSMVVTTWRKDSQDIGQVSLVLKEVVYEVSKAAR
jgi:hypothetical protein